MGDLFDRLRPEDDKARTLAAMRELIAEAEATAFCRETLLMLAVNYVHAAKAEQGARAQALSWAAEAIRED